MTAETQKATDYRIKEFSMELVLADGSPATPEVLYVALHDEDAEVQVRAAFGLATLGDLSPSVLDTLFDAADWRRDPEASATARYGIVELSKTNPAIIDRLLAALQQDKVALSGVAACLSEIGQATPAVIDALVAFSQHSDDIYATVSAVYTLIQLGYETDELIERLFTLHGHGDVVVRAVALDAFTLLKEPPPKAIDLLLVAVRRGKLTARDAARGLARVGLDQPQVIDALVQASSASDWELRAAAIEGLGKVTNPGPAVAEALYNALSDRDSFVRMQAIAGVGHLSKTNPSVIDKLLTMLEAEEQKAQQQKEERKPQVSTNEEARPPLSALQELETMSHLRGNIAITLAQLGCINDAVCAAFLAELGDEDASVRERIVRNWGLLGNSHPSMLDALQSALQDESELVRKSAAASLEKR